MRSLRRLIAPLGVFVTLLGLVGPVRTTVAAPQALVTIPVEAPVGVAINPITKRVYSANGPSNVSVIDAATNGVLATIPVASRPNAVAVNPATNRIYATMGFGGSSDNSVAVIDGASNLAISTIAVGTNPLGVAVNATTDRIYVANWLSGSVSVIDGANNMVVATISIGTGASLSGPTTVKVNETTNRVYATDSFDNTLWVIDGTNNTVVRTIPVGNDPSDVAVNPTTNRIYTANYGEASVSVIDGSSNTLITTIPIRAYPLGVAVNSTTNRVYTTTTNNSMSLIDASTDALVTSISVGHDPVFVTVNPSDGRVYVANLDDNTISVIDESGALPPLPALVTLPQPQRLADTRLAGGPISTGSSRCFNMAGQAGIGSDAVGVLLNVTATGYPARGWLTLYANGQPVPATSTLNFEPNSYAIANGVITRVGSGGQVCVKVGTVNDVPGSAQIILDATGYLTSTSALQTPLLLQPKRLVDTRLSGGPLLTGTSRCFSVAGQGGIPGDAVGVLLNVTGVGYSTPGWLTLYPNGQAVPATSTLTVDPHAYAIANGAIARVGTSGQLCVAFGTVNSAAGSSQVILDATGYVTSAGAVHVPLLSEPRRLVDTRLSGGPIPSGTAGCFKLAGQGGIPSDASGVVLNVTSVGYATPGWITVYPNGQSLPATSTLNFDTSEYAIANGSIMELGTGGLVCVNVGTPNSMPGSAHVVLDVTGYLPGLGTSGSMLAPRETTALTATSTPAASPRTH